MSGTKRLLIEEAPKGRIICDEKMANYRRCRGDSIPSDIDFKLATELDRRFRDLARAEQKAVDIVMTAYIFSFPVPFPVYHQFEHACYRLLVSGRHGRKEKGGGSSE